MSATVTVLVPVHNAADYLEASLGSLVRQTFADWECICLDDESSDESHNILTRFAAADRRFRIIDNSRSQGVSVARNILLDAAQGEWMFFLDADDLLASDCLETLYECVCSSGVSLALAQYERFHTVPPTCSRENEVKVLSGDDWYRLRAKRYSYARPATAGDVFSNVACQPWNKLIRRNLLNGLRFEKGLRSGEDLVLFADVLRRVDSVAISSRVTYFYRHTPHSLDSMSDDYKSFHAVAKAVCRLARNDREPRMSDYVARRWVLSWIRSVWHWNGFGKHPVAKTWFTADCRRLRKAFEGHLPFLSWLALSWAPCLFRMMAAIRPKRPSNKT